MAIWGDALDEGAVHELRKKALSDQVADLRNSNVQNVLDVQEKVHKGVHMRRKSVLIRQSAPIQSHLHLGCDIEALIHERIKVVHIVVIAQKTSHRMVLYTVDVECQRPYSDADHRLCARGKLECLCVQWKRAGVLVEEKLERVHVQTDGNGLEKGHVPVSNLLKLRVEWTLDELVDVIVIYFQLAALAAPSFCRADLQKADGRRFEELRGCAGGTSLSRKEK